MQAVRVVVLTVFVFSDNLHIVFPSVLDADVYGCVCFCVCLGHTTPSHRLCRQYCATVWQRQLRLAIQNRFQLTNRARRDRPIRSKPAAATFEHWHIYTPMWDASAGAVPPVAHRFPPLHRFCINTSNTQIRTSLDDGALYPRTIHDSNIDRFYSCCTHFPVSSGCVCKHYAQEVCASESARWGWRKWKPVKTDNHADDDDDVRCESHTSTHIHTHILRPLIRFRNELHRKSV